MTQSLTTLAALDAMIKSTGNERAAHIGSHIGVSASTVQKWRRENAMPRLASLACECVTRRNGGSGLVSELKSNELVQCARALQSANASKDLIAKFLNRLLETL